jgi:hypothetical protein
MCILEFITLKKMHLLVCISNKLQNARCNDKDINNCFAKCGCPADHVYRNDDNAPKLTDGEENDWHSLKPLQVQCGDSQHVTVQQRFVEFTVSIRCWISGWQDQKKNQKRRWLKKVTLLDAFKGSCVARKYECQSDIKDNIIIRCITLQN